MVADFRYATTLSELGFNARFFCGRFFAAENDGIRMRIRLSACSKSTKNKHLGTRGTQREEALFGLDRALLCAIHEAVEKFGNIPRGFPVYH
jgi:hypothetical protein